MPANDTQAIAALLLAAGESRRMGTQKQLLLINGKPMVRLAAERAREATAGPLIVVVGSNADEVTRALDGSNVSDKDLRAVCVLNPNWADGMGASLRHGIHALAQTSSEAVAVLIILADQPGISSAHLRTLIEHHRAQPHKIIATESGGVPQPPVIFPKAWFANLTELQGDRGARAILRESANDVYLVHADSIDDVDTPDDYAKFIQRSAG